MVRFGVLGTGRITRRLIADLQSTDKAQVTAIASRSKSRAQWCADQYGIVNPVGSYDELLRRDDVDAIYIALPPSLHYPYSIATAEHSKDLLCEKPLTIKAKETIEINRLFGERQKRWLDATGWLHHPRTSAFHRWVTDGTLGEIGHLSAALSFYQPFQSNDHRLDPSLGGGCLLDLGWYVCGFTRFFTGKLPIAISADVLLKNDVSQRFNAMLWFDNDVTATVSCGYDTATRKWFEVAGSAASLICDDFTRPWHDRPTRCWIHESSGKVHSHTFEGNQERKMIQTFIGNESLETFQQQAIDTQKILDAASESIASGKVVSILS
nr:Gfo/Idh/MocA family oxidoreductase [Rhodopirellula sp.]